MTRNGWCFTTFCHFRKFLEFPRMFKDFSSAPFDMQHDKQSKCGDVLGVGGIQCETWNRRFWCIFQLYGFSHIEVWTLSIKNTTVIDWSWCRNVSTVNAFDNSIWHATRRCQPQRQCENMKLNVFFLSVFVERKKKWPTATTNRLQRRHRKLKNAYFNFKFAVKRLQPQYLCIRSWSNLIIFRFGM